MPKLKIKRAMAFSINKINNEVLYAADPVVKVNSRDIANLCAESQRNKRKRIRLCTHRGVDDPLHEMLIVHTKDTYVRPHKHKNKIESFHIIEGRVDVILFNEEGHLTEVIPMGNYDSGLAFYYRIADPYYHTLMIRSEMLVFHETTNGPFQREDTVFAPWSPEEKEKREIKAFIRSLSASVEQLRSEKGEL